MKSSGPSWSPDTAAGAQRRSIGTIGPRGLRHHARFGWVGWFAASPPGVSEGPRWCRERGQTFRGQRYDLEERLDGYFDWPITLMMLTSNSGTVVLPPIWVS